MAGSFSTSCDKRGELNLVGHCTIAFTNPSVDPCIFYSRVELLPWLAELLQLLCIHQLPQLSKHRVHKLLFVSLVTLQCCEQIVLASLCIVQPTHQQHSQNNIRDCVLRFDIQIRSFQSKRATLQQKVMET